MERNESRNHQPRQRVVDLQARKTDPKHSTYDAIPFGNDTTPDDKYHGVYRGDKAHRAGHKQFRRVPGDHHKTGLTLSSRTLEFKSGVVSPMPDN